MNAAQSGRLPGAFPGIQPSGHFDPVATRVAVRVTGPGEPGRKTGRSDNSAADKARSLDSPDERQRGLMRAVTDGRDIVEPAPEGRPAASDPLCIPAAVSDHAPLPGCCS